VEGNNTGGVVKGRGESREVTLGVVATSPGSPASNRDETRTRGRTGDVGTGNWDDDKTKKLQTTNDGENGGSF